MGHNTLSHCSHVVIYMKFSHMHEIQGLYDCLLFVMMHLLTHLLLLLSNRAGNIALRLHHLLLDL